MRLHRRSAVEIRVARRGTGDVESFSEETVVLSGSVTHVNNALTAASNSFESGAYGVREAHGLRVRFMGDIPVAAGDGVMLPGDSRPVWRCAQVDRYPFVTVVRLERIAGAC